MSVPRCDITELLVTECAHCRKLPDDLCGESFKGPWILARYDGCCALCGYPFEAGSQIKADGAGGWIADCCEGDATP